MFIFKIENQEGLIMFWYDYAILVFLEAVASVAPSPVSSKLTLSDSHTATAELIVQQ